MADIGPIEDPFDLSDREAELTEFELGGPPYDVMDMFAERMICTQFGDKHADNRDFALRVIERAYFWANIMCEVRGRYALPIPERSSKIDLSASSPDGQDDPQSD
jgi:hypothetical protein